MAEGLECFRLLFPKGMDANAYACAVKPAENPSRRDPLGAVARARCCKANTATTAGIRGRCATRYRSASGTVAFPLAAEGRSG